VPQKRGLQIKNQPIINIRLKGQVEHTVKKPSFLKRLGFFLLVLTVYTTDIVSVIYVQDKKVFKPLAHAFFVAYVSLKQ